eukprot:TRINITY_DN2966_c1_g1_i3.p1 TRINITY_DN2966_c1_g1~~TRINITY_DN2966_c1_g1_i3.p1  ORF type:complete len:5802 (+),score=1072.37 TRINITY_DN2966_c1_g1_i3:2529-19934(+)
MSRAGKNYLYDNTPNAPPVVITMTSMSLVDTDPQANSLGGTAQWLPDPANDEGYTSEWKVFVATDSAGAGKVLVATVPRGTNEVVLPLGTAAGTAATHVLIYASNQHGIAPSASSAEIILSANETEGRTTVTTTTTTVAFADTVASGVTFSDTDNQGVNIQGIISWTPPVDTSDVTRYGVFISVDEAMSERVALWPKGGSSQWVPVGTNQLDIYLNTQRQTGSLAYCDWIYVIPFNGPSELPRSRAGKLPLYDESGNAPPAAVAMTSITFTDEDPRANAVGGLAQWSPDPAADEGFTAQWAVYVAVDSSGTNMVHAGSVPRGTNELDIPFGTANGVPADHVLVFAENSHGLAPSAASASFVPYYNATAAAAYPVLAPATTATTTSATSATTSTTATTTTALVLVTGISFTDMDTRAEIIDGQVSWTPPAVIDDVTRYVVFIAKDIQNTQRAQIWDFNSKISYVPVGTNFLEIYPDTYRYNTNSELCQWIFVEPHNGGGRVPGSGLSYAPLYDDANSVPPSVPGNVVVDPGGGSVIFDPQDGVDEGHVTYYGVYVNGDNLTMLGNVSRGTNQLVIPNDETPPPGSEIIVYPENPYGQGPASGSATVPAAGETSTTLTTSTTSSTSRMVTEEAITSVVYVDNDPLPDKIAGTLSWVPPDDLTGITRYEVYISHDTKDAAHKAKLWDGDTSNAYVPVGTNQINIWPVPRATMDSDYPANWVLIYPVYSGRLGALKETGRCPLYDESGGVPPFQKTIFNVSFVDTDPAEDKIAGVVRWDLVPYPDLGFTQQWGIYIAFDQAGSGLQQIGTASREDTEFTIPPGTATGYRNVVFVKPMNAHGSSVEGAAAEFMESVLTTTTAYVDYRTNTTTTTTTADGTCVGDITYADTDPREWIIQGDIKWEPPLDTLTVTHFIVFISNDEANTARVTVWQQGDTDGQTPVGTNVVNIWLDTLRSTTLGWPCNWLHVASYKNSKQLCLHTIPLYDNAGRVPNAVPMTSFEFDDQDLTLGDIYGRMSWVPDRQSAETGYSAQFDVYLAEDASGTGKVFLGNVARLDRECSIEIPFGTQAEPRRYALVYGRNSYGMGSAATALELIDRHNLSTTLPSTTTTPAGPTVGSVSFSDADPSPNVIDGTIVWQTPFSEAGITRYEVYIANDENGGYGALLVDDISKNAYVSVGTNQMTIVADTGRYTTDLSFPANFLLVRARRSDIGLEDISKASITPLYDESGAPPPAVAIQDATFVDTDASPTSAGGTVQWSVPANADLGFIEKWSVYFASDPRGSYEIHVGTVPSIERQLDIPDGTNCGLRSHVLIYAENSHGRSSSPIAVQFQPVQVSSTTSTTATSTTTTSTTTVLRSPHSITYIDTDNQLGILGGVVRWKPPDISAGITKYGVFIAVEQDRSVDSAQLWDKNVGIWIPVGVNQLTVTPNTYRMNLNSDPCNWLLVIPFNGNTALPDRVGRTTLYDESGGPPVAAKMLFDVTFSDNDPDPDEIGGTFYWLASPGADLGTTTDFVVALGGNESDFSAVSPLGQTSRDGTQFEISANTHIGGNLTHLLLYARNPHGATIVAFIDLFAKYTSTTTVTFGNTSTTTTSTTAFIAAISVSYADTDPRPKVIQGKIIWIPPTNTGTITKYLVEMSVDELRTKSTPIWDQSSVSSPPFISVGTNELNIWFDWERDLVVNELCEYIFVIPYSGNSPDYSRAASTPLYDDIGSPPPVTALENLEFVDTNPATGTLAGELKWVPTSGIDHGTTLEYKAYVASDASGTGAVPIGSSPRGTNSLTISASAPDSHRYLLVYASNTNGLASSPVHIHFLPLYPSTTSATTSATTTSPLATTTTSTTSTTPRIGSVGAVSYSDTDDRPTLIQGVIQWVPPSDLSYVTRYAVYCSTDEVMTDRQELWAKGAISKWVPVGVNQLDIWVDTTRTTLSGALCQWLLVVPYSGDIEGGTDTCGLLRLYDSTGSAPDMIPILDMDFKDYDPGVGDDFIEGTASWTVDTSADLATTTGFDVILARDSSGNDPLLLTGNIPHGTETLEVPRTDTGGRPFMLIYARNNFGRASSASFYDYGLRLPPVTRTTTSTTTTLEDFILRPFTDIDTRAEVIQGVIQWTPPWVADGITSYGVYYSVDVNNTNRIEVWAKNALEHRVPYGTNELDIWWDTFRKSPTDELCQWIVVVPFRGTREGTIAESAIQRLVDKIDTVPPATNVEMVDFYDNDGGDEEVGGLVRWTPAEGADMAYTERWEVYFAYSHTAAGEQFIQSVPITVNEVSVPQGTFVGYRNHVLVFAANDVGKAETAAAFMFAPPTVTNTTTTSTSKTTSTSATTTTATTTTTNTSVTTTTSTSTTSTSATTTTTTTTTSANLLSAFSFTFELNWTNDIGMPAPDYARELVGGNGHAIKKQIDIAVAAGLTSVFHWNVEVLWLELTNLSCDETVYQELNGVPGKGSGNCKMPNSRLRRLSSLPEEEDGGEQSIDGNINERQLSAIDCRTRWEVTDGSCTIDSNCCALSPNYPSNYGLAEICKIVPKADFWQYYYIDAVAFDTEATYDKLWVNNVPYSGNTFPEKLVPTGTIVWDSDRLVAGSGWKLCPAYDPSKSTSSTSSTTSSTSTTTTTTSGNFTPVPCFADNGDAQAWEVKSGDCYLDYACCINSPNFPNNYGVSESCVVNVIDVFWEIYVIRATHFDTEAGYDKLWVNGNAYSGSSFPADIVPRGTILWDSDRQDAASGWRLCPEFDPRRTRTTTSTTSSSSTSSTSATTTTATTSTTTSSTSATTTTATTSTTSTATTTTTTTLMRTGIYMTIKTALKIGGNLIQLADTLRELYTASWISQFSWEMSLHYAVIRVVDIDGHYLSREVIRDDFGDPNATNNTTPFYDTYMLSYGNTSNVSNTTPYVKGDVYGGYNLYELYGNYSFSFGNKTHYPVECYGDNNTSLVWNVRDGSCTIDEDCCALSPNYPGMYPDGETCTIDIVPRFWRTHFLRPVEFQTEELYDKLWVNSVPFSGNTFPIGLFPTQSLLWDADRLIQGKGWKICPWYDPARESTTSTSTTSTTSPGPLDYNRSEVICNDGNGTQYVWDIISGECAIDSDCCLTSPNFPNPYDNDQSCSVNPIPSFWRDYHLLAVDFLTEKDHDKLWVNSVAYSGTEGPPMGYPAGQIIWNSDRLNPERGWRLCPQLDPVKVTTSTTTSTSTTSTTATTVNGTSNTTALFIVTGVSFMDTDTRPEKIQGVITWVPPKEAWRATHYAVYLSVDEGNYEREQLYDNGHVGSPYVPVGINRLVLLPNADRKLPNGKLSTWIHVVPVWEGVAVGEPGRAPLYDDPGGPPPETTAMSRLNFTDDDGERGNISGLVEWETIADPNLAYASAFTVYFARKIGSGSYTNRVFCGEAPRGVGQLEVTKDIQVEDRNVVLLYAKNSYGEAPNAAETLLIDWETLPPTFAPTTMAPTPTQMPTQSPTVMPTVEPTMPWKTCAEAAGVTTNVGECEALGSSNTSFQCSAACSPGQTAVGKLTCIDTPTSKYAFGNPQCVQPPPGLIVVVTGSGAVVLMISITTATSDAPSDAAFADTVAKVLGLSPSDIHPQTVTAYTDPARRLSSGPYLFTFSAIPPEGTDLSAVLAKLANMGVPGTPEYDLFRNTFASRHGVAVSSLSIMAGPFTTVVETSSFTVAPTTSTTTTSFPSSASACAQAIDLLREELSGCEMLEDDKYRCRKNCESGYEAVGYMYCIEGDAVQAGMDLVESNSIGNAKIGYAMGEPTCVEVKPSMVVVRETKKVAFFGFRVWIVEQWVVEVTPARFRIGISAALNISQDYIKNITVKPYVVARRLEDEEFFTQENVSAYDLAFEIIVPPGVPPDVISTRAWAIVQNNTIQHEAFKSIIYKKEYLDVRFTVGTLRPTILDDEIYSIQPATTTTPPPPTPMPTLDPEVAFDVADVNDDQHLDNNEAQKAGGNTSGIADVIDTNNDGKVSNEEFDAVDADDDGKVDREEMNRAVLFDGIDTNRSGGIDREEANALNASDPNSGFDAFDSNNDGRISDEEFEDADADGNGEVDMDEWQQANEFNDADTDNSGSIDSGEANAHNIPSSDFNDMDANDDGVVDPHEWAEDGEFESADTNNDGRVDPAEAADADISPRTFDDMDANNDGGISRDEWAQAGWFEKADMNDNHLVTRAEASAEGLTAADFEAIDANHDGALSLREWCEAGTFRAADADRNGIVSWAEAQAAGLSLDTFRAMNANRDAGLSLREWAQAGLFRALDTNSDTRIDMAEAVAGNITAIMAPAAARLRIRRLAQAAVISQTAEYFRAMDANGDNFISLAEWEQADWFNIVDTDGDGRVNRSEAARVGVAAAAFAQLDANADGVATLHEWEQAGSFHFADSNSDSRVDPSEALAVGITPTVYGALDPNEDVKLVMVEWAQAGRFRSIDTNNDGTLQPNEGQAVGWTSVRFSDMDGNSDGRVNLNEFEQAGLFERADANSDGVLVPAEVEAIFHNAVDINQDGIIDRSEANAVDPAASFAGTLDANRDGRVSNEEFNAFDANRDGGISVDEWAQAGAFDQADNDNSGDVDRSEALRFGITEAAFVAMANDAGKVTPDVWAQQGPLSPTRIFSYMDRNKDGVVPLKEWSTARFFDMADSDGDGVVDVEEQREAGMTDDADANADTKITQEEWTEAQSMDEVDTNGDGRLDRNEARAANFTDDWFDKTDANDDGVVDRAEWQEESEFEDADTNDDGKIDRDEAEAVDIPSSRFDDMDGNGNGTVSLDEWAEAGYFERTDMNDDGAVDGSEATAAGISSGDFDAMDADGDGEVDLDEWQQAGWFETIDTNGDGTIDPAEASAANIARPTFDDIDANDDGGLSLSEFVQGSYFRDVDTDGNGVVDWTEASAVNMTASRFSGTDVNNDNVITLAEWAEAASFDHADTNNDGRVDASEASVAGVSPAEFAAMDANDDGALDVREWNEAGRFDRADTNNDGVLNVTEAAAAGFPPGNFGAMDADGNGSASLSEWEEAAWFDEVDANNDGLVALAEARAAGISGDVFSFMDANQDGSVTLQEWAQAGLFDHLDADDSGFVDAREAQAAGMPPAEFAALDANHDGQIDRGEWTQASSFDAMDRNGDDRVNASEARAYGVSSDRFEASDASWDGALILNEWAQAGYFDRIDTNNDDSVSSSEAYEANVSSERWTILDSVGGGSISLARWAQAAYFDLTDVNKDDFVVWTEAEAVGIDGRMFARMDANGDNSITLLEWLEVRAPFPQVNGTNQSDENATEPPTAAPTFFVPDRINAPPAGVQASSTVMLIFVFAFFGMVVTVICLARVCRRCKSGKRVAGNAVRPNEGAVELKVDDAPSGNLFPPDMLPGISSDVRPIEDETGWGLPEDQEGERPTDFRQPEVALLRGAFLGRAADVDLPSMPPDMQGVLSRSALRVAREAEILAPETSHDYWQEGVMPGDSPQRLSIPEAQADLQLIESGSVSMLGGQLAMPGSPMANGNELPELPELAADTGIGEDLQRRRPSRGRLEDDWSAPDDAPVDMVEKTEGVILMEDESQPNTPMASNRAQPRWPLPEFGSERDPSPDDEERGDEYLVPEQDDGYELPLGAGVFPREDSASTTPLPSSTESSSNGQMANSEGNALFETRLDGYTDASSSQASPLRVPTSMPEFSDVYPDPPGARTPERDPASSRGSSKERSFSKERAFSKGRSSSKERNEASPNTMWSVPGDQDISPGRSRRLSTWSLPQDEDQVDETHESMGIGFMPIPTNSREQSGNQRANLPRPAMSPVNEDAYADQYDEDRSETSSDESPQRPPGPGGFGFAPPARRPMRYL